MSEGRRKLPPLAQYQVRACEGAAAAIVKRGEDVLIEAPTGAGKTPIIARTARHLVARGGKVLVLTHRKTLFRQMVGKPSAESRKERAGEMRWWGGLRPGTIADPSLGGINQQPGLVVGMVETVANRIDELEGYTAIFIDETQHASGKSAEGEDKGAYARVISALPGARVVGLTATTFRGDGDHLHPRLEAAHREVVAIEEARAAGRIVPARTVIGKAPLRSGRSVAELVTREAEGRLEKSASAILKEERGEAFYNHVVEDWERVMKRRKTIVFVDSVAEVEDMRHRFEARYGCGMAVSLHGRKGQGENDAAILSYGKGEARILIACQMIGEGFDVPDTDGVMSLNTSLSRLEMNQYVGRCLRAAEAKEYGLFLDYGTASHRHGWIEHQHQLQNVDALAACGSKIAAARALARMAPVQQGGWRVACGENRSLFIQAIEGKYAVFEYDHRAEREIGRRKGRKDGPMGRLVRIDHPQKGSRPLPIGDVAQLVAEHARTEAGFLALMGGVESKAYQASCGKALDHWKGMFRIIEQTDALHGKVTDAQQARREAIGEAIFSPCNGRHRSRMLRKSLESAKTGTGMVREAMALSGAVLGHCSDRQDIPLGLRAELRMVAEGLREQDLARLEPGRIRKEALAVTATMRHLRSILADPDLDGVIGDVADPLEKGVSRMEREMRSKAQKRPRTGATL